MSNKESKTQKKIIDYIRANGGYVYKNAQNMYTERGRPDLTACLPVSIGQLMKLWGPDRKVGLFVGLEVKQPGLIENTSFAQEVVGRQIQQASGLWFRIDDEYLIMALMDKLKGGTDESH